MVFSHRECINANEAPAEHLMTMTFKLLEQFALSESVKQKHLDGVMAVLKLKTTKQARKMCRAGEIVG